MRPGLTRHFQVLRIDLLEKQELNRAVVRKASRRQNPRIVEHEELVWPNELGEIGEAPMGNRPFDADRAPSCARPRAERRPLRDQLVRQRKIVIVHSAAHRRTINEATCRLRRNVLTAS